MALSIERRGKTASMGSRRPRSSWMHAVAAVAVIASCSRLMCRPLGSGHQIVFSALVAQPMRRGRGTDGVSSKVFGKQCAHHSRTRVSCATEDASEEDASTPPLQTSANLAKTIVGSGMLSLPAGMAAFARSPSALVPATLGLVVPLGLLSAYTFYLVGWVCEQTQTDSYGAAWGKILGKAGGRLITLVVALECAGGCVAYAMILGDTIHLLLAPFTSAAIASRSSVILLLTTFVLFPLSRLRNLAPLGKFSIVGTAGSAFVAVFMGLRYFQRAYMPGGKFAAVATAVAKSSGPKSAVDSLILASILSTAFIAHFNAPRMYRELAAPAGGGSKMPRFARVVYAGFAVAIVLYAFVMAF
eukprot:738515-Amphidinium_carterae.1